MKTLLYDTWKRPKYALNLLFRPWSCSLLWLFAACFIPSTIANFRSRGDIFSWSMGELSTQAMAIRPFQWRASNLGRTKFRSYQKGVRTRTTGAEVWASWISWRLWSSVLQNWYSWTSRPQRQDCAIWKRKGLNLGASSKKNPIATLFRFFKWSLGSSFGWQYHLCKSNTYSL